MTHNDMVDALTLSMGIKIVESPFIEQGKAFLFRDPMPLEFKIQEPERKPDRDFLRVAVYGQFHIPPSPVGIIMSDYCDLLPPIGKVRKWHWKYRGPRRRSRRLRPNPSDQRAGEPTLPTTKTDDAGSAASSC